MKTRDAVQRDMPPLEEAAFGSIFRRVRSCLDDRLGEAPSRSMVKDLLEIGEAVGVLEPRHATARHMPPFLPDIDMERCRVRGAVHERKVSVRDGQILLRALWMLNEETSEPEPGGFLRPPLPEADALRILDILEAQEIFEITPEAAEALLAGLPSDVLSGVVERLGAILAARLSHADLPEENTP
jgi:hypothetical protein